MLYYARKWDLEGCTSCFAVLRQKTGFCRDSPLSSNTTPENGILRGWPHCLILTRHKMGFGGAMPPVFFYYARKRDVGGLCLLSCIIMAEHGILGRCHPREQDVVGPTTQYSIITPESGIWERVGYPALPFNVRKRDFGGSGDSPSPVPAPTLGHAPFPRPRPPAPPLGLTAPPSGSTAPPPVPARAGPRCRRHRLLPAPPALPARPLASFRSGSIL